MPAKPKIVRLKPSRKSQLELGSPVPSERLRFSTTILRLLGEELNPSPDQGILELIKNAYDADAKHCLVELTRVNRNGGSLSVSDDGNGMTAEEIRNGWLIIGDSLKRERTKSPEGRLLVGSKGLGRLGALRLGNSVRLITRPKKEPGTQYSIEIDWKAFDRARVVEDVELAVKTEVATKGTKHGTEIHIFDLPMVWREADVKRLARVILLLRDPFDRNRSFVASLKAPEFRKIERFARTGYFKECDYHLRADLDNNGKATAFVETAGGKKLAQADHSQISSDKGHPPYLAPAASFDLWEFNLQKGLALSSKQTTQTALKTWLAEFGGVRLYHRGVRVLPYGEPKNDWLDMNLKRSQHQELRPSTNNSAGRVWITDPKGILLQKTDRLGFVESDEVEELRRFLDDALNWMATERRRERDQRLKTEKKRVEQQKRAADTALTAALSTLSSPKRKPLEAAVGKLRDAHQAEIALKDDTAQLYYTMATVGTTAAAFAHQTKNPISGIVEDADLLEDYLGDSGRLALFREESSKAVERIRRQAKAIYSFANVTIRLLEHEKRRSRAHFVHDLINETLELFDHFFEIRKTKPVRDYSDGNPKIWCTKAAFEAILTNLLTNSLQAFTRPGEASRPKGGRQIYIRTRVAEDSVSIVVQDNGPGIEKLSLDDIWIAGKTTTDKGTGLGLTIVKDVVRELHGKVEADAHGEYGGAMFTVTLPLRS